MDVVDKTADPLTETPPVKNPRLDELKLPARLRSLDIEPAEPNEDLDDTEKLPVRTIW